MEGVTPVRRGAASDRRGDPFVVYVEGPSDREIVRGWVQRASPTLGRTLDEAVRILGGRQPERALEHFCGLRETRRGARALCVLDRDGDLGLPRLPAAEPGLEFFTWSRRHIESYLLVPDAIRRGLRLPAHDQRVARILGGRLPPRGDEDAYRAIDAKRLLTRDGDLARALGRPIPLGRIAQAMHESEFHLDILSLLARLRAGFGLL